MKLANCSRKSKKSKGINSPFVVVPGDDLDEVVVQRDTGLSVEDRGVVVSVEIAGDELILGVGEDTSERASSGLFDGGLDSLVGSGLLKADGKINNGDVLGGDTHGHSSELSVQLGDDLANSLWNNS